MQVAEPSKRAAHRLEPEESTTMLDEPTREEAMAAFAKSWRRE
jgi:hypothetical protein